MTYSKIIAKQHCLCTKSHSNSEIQCPEKTEADEEYLQYNYFLHKGCQQTS